MRIVEATVVIESAMSAEGDAARLEPAHAIHEAAPVLEVLGPDALVEPVRVSSGDRRLRALVAAPQAGPLLEGLREACSREGGGPQLVHLAGVSLPELAHRVRHPLASPEAAALRTAFRLGYYETPRACRLTDVATHLGESVAPVHRRIQAAERHVFAALAGPASGVRPRRRARADAERVAGPVEATLRVRWPALEPTGTACWIAGWTARGSFRLAPAEGAPAPPEATEKGLAEIAAALGTDACLRPALLAADGAWLRVELLDGTRLEEVAHRVDEVGRAVGWQGAEVVAIAPTGGRAPRESAPPLTARQAQVLRLAHALGYYRTPRGCGLQELATALGVSVNAVHKSLTAAENRTVAQYLASQW